jgi:hypothetical protein
MESANMIKLQHACAHAESHDTIIVFGLNTGSSRSFIIRDDVPGTYIYRHSTINV